MSTLHTRRQLKRRVLEALEERVKGFRRREELWPLRVPPDPILLDDVVEQALGEERRGFDPAALRSRTLLELRWEDGSLWTAWVCSLPSGLKLYCDTGGGESRILASGGRNEGDQSDRVFLQLLAESGGGHFGIELSGEAPCCARAGVADRAFLADVLVDLFEVAGLEPEIRRQAAHLDTDGKNDAEADDFRIVVERWLERAAWASRSHTVSKQRGDHRR